MASLSEMPPKLPPNYLRRPLKCGLARTPTTKINIDTEKFMPKLEQRRHRRIHSVALQHSSHLLKNPSRVYSFGLLPRLA